MLSSQLCSAEFVSRLVVAGFTRQPQHNLSMLPSISIEQGAAQNVVRLSISSVEHSPVTNPAAYA